MNEQRQPKGTSVGGQFAPSKNAEPDIDLGRCIDVAGARRVFEVEYCKDDDYRHDLVEANDKPDAIRKVSESQRVRHEDVVGVVECDGLLGVLRHRQLWPHGEVLRRERGHEFVTSEMLESIPDLYETEDIALAQKTIHARFFSSAGTWHIAEMDKREGLAFGHCDLGMGYPEWGYVSLIELEEVSGRLGPAVERDLDFVPATADALGLI